MKQRVVQPSAPGAGQSAGRCLLAALPFVLLLFCLPYKQDPCPLQPGVLARVHPLRKKGENPLILRARWRWPAAFPEL